MKMPNTNYCGPNLPGEFDKPLGSDQQTDSCCFDHDSCPYNIYSGETKYGLTNTMKVTMSWCACDQAFCGCLKLVGTTASNVVGMLFFSIYQPYCFDFLDWTVMQAVKRSSYSFVTPPTCHEPEPTIMK
ncbi:Phospholipase A(2) [Clonorchis sinensis]|uniref:Phospholipase A(2) n=1 Tax=Clonorchis sinensis TaxID=79923 RepID=A0A419PW78_CLOSI|nr:Phospholipase A(2) [Clonorchis sinensis]